MFFCVNNGWKTFIDGKMRKKELIELSCILIKF